MSAILEIACCNLQSCENAQLGGAQRIELFENILEGGCTPSYGTILKAKRRFQLPIYVMIRPRGGNFQYSAAEFETMQRDIESCKQLQVDGIVFGILNSNRRIDIERCRELLNLWSGKATFHRAIDESSNYLEDAQITANLGFERLLTSGAALNVMDGLGNIQRVQHELGSHITIMPGCGVTPSNALEILETTGCHEIHATCKTLWNGTWVSDLETIQSLAMAINPPKN